MFSLEKSKRQYLMFIYFQLLPFLIEIKELLIKSLKKAPNQGLVKVFLLNTSKVRSVNAKEILEFINSFLTRKKLKIRKIRKLFYKILKYVKFMLGKQRCLGFKFVLAGRFTRRDRVTFI